MSQVDFSKESVVVIGAGLAGCFVACELRRRGYGEVILVERLNAVCGVGPRVVSEIHAGGEYPFDRQSAIDCLHGLAVLMRTLPAGAIAKPRSHLLIAKGTASNEMDGVRYSQFLNGLRCEYESMVRQDPGLEQVICAVRDFWRRLDPDEYADTVNVESGFETPQRGVLPSDLALAVNSALESSGVIVRLGHEVLSAARRGVGEFRVQVQTGARISDIDCSQVVFANHVAGFGMATALADSDFRPPESIFIALRMIAEVDYNVPRHFPSPTRLMLEGNHGAMDAPMGTGRALVYHPPLSHVEIRELRAPFDIPQQWLERRASPMFGDLERADRIVARAAEIAYPYLRSASVREPRLAIAVNSVNNSRVRRNMGLMRPTRDCVSLAFTTKATTTALNAARAADVLVSDARTRVRPQRAPVC
ncbi:FAD-dependent oxidoreductase [Micromonospora sp. NBC_01392]|uniref:FAD-dependent oxidoreductase n=1 Tax=Micromonospora sp. NBC_01392 TaxID=2903588 RepID=UPI00324CB038